MSKKIKLSLDMRSILLLAITAGFIAMSNISLPFLLFILGLTFLLLSCTATSRITFGWLTAVLLLACFAWILPLLFPNQAIITIGFITNWLIRFQVPLGFAGIFLSTVQPAAAAAVLTQLRTPRYIFVPCLVIIRYFPMAGVEYRGIREAMILRGLDRGLLHSCLHPLRFAELMIIPFLLSATRVADELSAAAIIKGLGSKEQRTSLQHPHFRFIDGVILLLAVTLIILKIADMKWS